MEYIRLVHPKNFDFNRGRFSDLAFKRSSDGGMSIIDRICAEGVSGGLICHHIRVFYPAISGEPPIFYILQDNELPSGFTLRETLSDTGDKCHREVDDVSDNQLYKAFKNKREPHMFFTCDGTEPRRLTAQDLERWR